MIVYCGEDTYESYKAAQLHVQNISKSKEQEYITIDVDELKSLNDFLALTDSIDMFSSSNVIFAKRIFENKEIAGYFAENLASLKEKDIVVWIDKNLDSKTKLFKNLKSSDLVKTFELPKRGDVIVWIENLAKQMNVKVGSEVKNYILDNVGDNKGVISQLFNKFKILKIEELKTKDVMDIAGLTTRGDLWKFVDYVGNRDKISAIKEFEKLTLYEDLSQLIISLIQREFRIISQIHYSNGNTSGLGIAPFILKKSLTKSRRFTKNDLKNFTQRLFNLDFAIKSGEIDEKIGLTLFLLTL